MAISLSHLQGLLPPMDEMTKWRLSISCVAIVGLLHVLWACGWIPGFSGFAFADEVDQKIERALTPIKEEIGQAKAQAVANSKYLKTLVLAQHAETIRGLVRSRCNTNDAQEKERLNTLIESYQSQYMEVGGDGISNGPRYQEPDCEDL